MSSTISMPLRINPYLKADMDDPKQKKKFIDWMRGAGDRYAHAHGPRDSGNPVYMEGYSAELPNGELTK